MPFMPLHLESILNCQCVLLKYIAEMYTTDRQLSGNLNSKGRLLYLSWF